MATTWQVMRLSRNRNWAHPDMVALLERLAARAHKDAGWPGILVGDMSQPRGGPMFTGHASHQVGLDADVWLTPMPNRQLSRNEREEMSAVMMVRSDRLDIDPHAWTPSHLAVIRAAALEPSVQRIFVNAAIKKALCREAKGDRSWLSKVRPMYGHDYHFHIRIRCPAGAANARASRNRPKAKACSAGDLAYWFKDSVLHPKPPKEPPKPKPPMTLAQLPAACRRCWQRRTRSNSTVMLCAGCVECRSGAVSPRALRTTPERTNPRCAACRLARSRLLPISARNQIKGTVLGMGWDDHRMSVSISAMARSSPPRSPTKPSTTSASRPAVTVVIKASDVMIAVD